MSLNLINSLFFFLTNPKSHVALTRGILRSTKNFRTGFKKLNLPEKKLKVGSFMNSPRGVINRRIEIYFFKNFLRRKRPLLVNSYNFTKNRTSTNMPVNLKIRKEWYNQPLNRHRSIDSVLGSRLFFKNRYYWGKTKSWRLGYSNILTTKQTSFFLAKCYSNLVYSRKFSINKLSIKK